MLYALVSISCGNIVKMRQSNKRQYFRNPCGSFPEMAIVLYAPLGIWHGITRRP
jgi:hypothetical protein